MKNLMITQEQKVMALSQIHPARDDLDYLEGYRRTGGLEHRKT